MFTVMNPRAAAAYQRINVETSMHTIDQHQLVSLLYEGVLGAIATARGALARGDVSTKCGSISKAVRILEEGLMTALDRQAGKRLPWPVGGFLGYRELIVVDVFRRAYRFLSSWRC